MYSRSRMAWVNGVNAPMSIAIVPTESRWLCDAVELVGDHAAVLAALRHLDAGELLAAMRPALVAEHRGDVVDAVGVRA